VVLDASDLAHLHLLFRSSFTGGEAPRTAPQVRFLVVWVLLLDRVAVGGIAFVALGGVALVTFFDVALVAFVSVFFLGFVVFSVVGVRLVAGLLVLPQDVRDGDEIAEQRDCELLVGLFYALSAN
jgi:hypothetical protein